MIEKNILLSTSSGTETDLKLKEIEHTGDDWPFLRTQLYFMSYEIFCRTKAVIPTIFFLSSRPLKRRYTSSEKMFPDAINKMNPKWNSISFSSAQ